MPTLKIIPLLDNAPDDSYEPTPQLGWFVRKDKSNTPVSELYQLWQQTVFSEKPSPEQIWVKVPEYTNPNDEKD